MISHNISLNRILHLRLVLLRPNVLSAARHSLTSFIPHPSTSRAEIALRTEVSSISIQAAVSAIDILHANLRSVPRLMSSNAVFVTLSAATVIVAASLVPELNVTLDSGSSYGDEIAKAFQVLHEHRWQIEGAQDARGQLEKFMETVKQAKQRRNGNLSLFIPFARHQSDAAF
jgi:hypothetical protein